MRDVTRELADAVQLIDEGRFGDAAGLLALLVNRADSAPARTLIDSAWLLCRAGATYQAAIEKLESAASEQRALETGLRRRLIALLTSVGDVDEPSSPSGRARRRRRWRTWISPAPDRPEIAEATPQVAGDEHPAIAVPETPPPGWRHPSSLPEGGVGRPEAEPVEQPGAVPEADVVARVLGNLELVVLGRPVREWGSVKGRAVLQYLLLSPGLPVRRETLMELLWPGHSHASARNNLNVALYALRRTVFPRDLGHGPFIEYTQGAYTLGRSVSWWVDRDAFLAACARAAAAQGEGMTGAARSALEDAVGLYRGRLFDDDPIGEWFLAEQRLLEERFLVVLERLASSQLAAGDVELAEATLQSALSRDACRESTHRLLMHCYAELHQQQLVTRQFRMCVEALGSELGIQPHPETVRTFHALTGEID